MKFFDFINITSVLATAFFPCLWCVLFAQELDVRLPILATDRTDISSLLFTDIGAFGLVRKARPKVPEHLHAGIDIKRPARNYEDEPIFAAMPGRVISLRNDGPFAQLIIEHKNDLIDKIWTVYEHIAGIQVNVGDLVSTEIPIARFMNIPELNRYGWQFDHFHFEIMRVAPRPLAFLEKTPHRFFAPYNLECFSEEELYFYYFDPIEFLNGYWGEF